MYIQTIPNVIVQVLIPRPELGWALPSHNWSSRRSVPAPQRGPRVSADGRLLVVYVAYHGMATQSWWRLHRVGGGCTELVEAARGPGRDGVLLPPFSPWERRPFANGRRPLTLLKSAGTTLDSVSDGRYHDPT